MTKRGMPKPFAILIAALLALYFVPLNALPADAQTVGGFEIEGDLVDDPGTAGIDWATVDTSSSSFATAVDHTTGSQDDTTFGGGSKEYNDGQNNGWPTWVYGGGNAPGKSDFGRWATYTNSDASNHLWLFLGFDRDFAQGTAKYAFELNQVMQADPDNPNPKRSQGDLRFIIWDQGNGSLTLTGDAQNTDVGLYRWIDPDQAAAGVAVDANQNGHWEKIGANGTFVGAINSGDVAVPSWWTSRNVVNGVLSADKFGEFGVDLTSFGAVLGCPSAGFSAANARSITGTGTTGALVDYLSALGVHIPSTCTSLVTNATNQVVVGNSISDTATITPSNATGTVTFNVYGPNDATCSNAPAATLGPIAVVNGSASSGPYLPTAVGTYRWIASYDSNDDAHFADSTGACNDPNEQSTVVKKQPTISTDAEDQAQLLSNNPSITDVATVSNLTSDASGTVTFRVYGPDDATCSGAVQFTDPEPLGTVTSNVAHVTSAAYSPTAAGTYRWVASYSGDAKNAPVAGACNDADESSIVLKSSPTITTDADDTAKLPDDATISDTATLSGVTADAGGTITFKLFGPDSSPQTPTCDDSIGGNLVFTSSAVTVNSSGSYGPESTTVTKAGTYFWIAYYSGDANNSAVAGVCGESNETSSVHKASPHISTTATNAQLPSPASISDTAHLTGLTSDAGGNVTFNVYGPFAMASEPTCTGTAFATKVVAVSGVGNDHAIDVASGAVPVNAAGKYYWVASYSGDGNNEAVTGSCGDTGETSTVNPTNPTIVTNATGGGLPAGAVTDSAQLTGVTDPARGTITFRLYGPSNSADCTGDAIFTSDPVTVTGPGSYGPVTTQVVEAGSYYWVASYSGDNNNNPIAGTCGESGETSTVTKAHPDIATNARATDDTLPGTSVKDTATLTGLSPNATGTVRFTLYSDATCDAKITTLGPVAIGAVNNGSASATSPSYTGLNEVGTYWFIASYSGDDNNGAVSGHCGDANENVTIKPAQPTITTGVPFSSVTLGPDGNDLTDEATLSGGTVTPPISGDIEFVLYGPFPLTQFPTANSCIDPADGVAGNRVAGTHNPQSVNVVGNGPYTTPNAVHVDKAGFYTWIATYSGDANNLTASHECGLPNETVKVLPRQPVITTQASATDLVIGSQGSVSFSDKATISEATNDVTGTITFKLFGPFAQAPTANSCLTGGAVQGTPVAVSGNGTYQGPTVSVSEKGYYTWMAEFTPTTGDGDNLSASHACGLPSETVHVFKGPNPTLTKIANPPSGSVVQPGDDIAYSVTVGNTGDVAISSGVVTDTLPPYVTVNPASISDGGVYTAGGDLTKSAGIIRWTVNLAPGATKTLTYTAKVNIDAPKRETLVNLAEFFGLQARTTHTVPSGDLAIVKEVSPVAGNGVVVEFGDTLTYTLTASASGDLKQPNVVVTDYLPGMDPVRPDSGKTTYVAGSAACIGAGSCTVTGPDANGLITWSLGEMAAGTTRQVTFQVTIDDVTGNAGETVAVDILNAGAVQSDRTPRTPSNEVVTPVTKVLPVKIPNQLPHTGTTMPIGPTVGGAMTLLGLGLLLMVASRRRSWVTRR